MEKVLLQRVVLRPNAHSLAKPKRPAIVLNAPPGAGLKSPASLHKRGPTQVEFTHRVDPDAASKTSCPYHASAREFRYCDLGAHNSRILSRTSGATPVVRSSASRIMSSSDALRKVPSLSTNRPVCSSMRRQPGIEEVRRARMRSMFPGGQFVLGRLLTGQRRTSLSEFRGQPTSRLRAWPRRSTWTR